MVGGPSEVYASSKLQFFVLDEPAFTQGFAKGLLARCFFRKPTRSSFIDKAGCTRQFESELSLRSFAQPFPSGYRGCANRPFNSLYDPFGSPCRGQKRSSNRYAIRLADHQRSTPAAELRFFVRDEPQGYTIQDVCCLLDAEGMLARCMLLAGIADKMDGALSNLLILASYSP